MRTVFLLVAISLSVIGLACLSISRTLGAIVLLLAVGMYLAAVNRRGGDKIRISVSEPGPLHRRGQPKHKFSAIGNLEPICPYCNCRLDKMPGRKKRCPHCGDFIYVRTRPLDRQKALLTSSQADQIKEEWAIHDGRHDDYLRRKRAQEEASVSLSRARAALRNGREIVPACPYCGSVLRKPPKRRAKCPHCAECIYVKSDQALYATDLLTQEQMVCLNTFEYLRRWGLGEADFQATKAQLTSQFGKEAGAVDTVWGLCQRAVLSLDDLRPEAPELYRQMALFNYRLGRPFFDLLQTSTRFALRAIEASCFAKYGRRVEIRSDECSVCQSQAGRVLSIKEALRTMPIPRKDCACETSDGPPGFCTCYYQQVID